jgi:hypothetical protein
MSQTEYERPFEMFSPKPFTERPQHMQMNRSFQKRLSVQPAKLADKGNPRGVAIIYGGKFMVLTEDAAINLINTVTDALEMEIPE